MSKPEPRTSSHDGLLVPKPELPLLAVYRGPVASMAGDPEDLPGLLLALRELMKGPQRHPDDRVDKSRLREAVVTSVAGVIIDLMSEDDDKFLDVGKEEEDDDNSLDLDSGSDIDDDD